MSATCLREPKNVKVRKDHICQGCGKKILKGEEAVSSSYADGGEAWTFRECQTCREYFDENCRGCGDFEYCIGESYGIGTIAECKRERKR